MKLPSISGRECVSALPRIGFMVRRQSGSHIILQRDDPYALGVVPALRAVLFDKLA